MIHKFLISENFLELIILGFKKYDATLQNETSLRVKTGDIIIFNDRFPVKVSEINKYSCFMHWLVNDDYEECVPGVNSIFDALDLYHRFYSYEDEMERGVIAFKFELLNLSN